MFFRCFFLNFFFLNIHTYSKAGPLRFRGHQEHTNDLTNLEQQSVYQERKVKSSFRRMRLFTQPVSFSSWDWVPWFWITVTVLYLGLMTATVNVIHSSLPSPKMLEDISVTGDESERFVAARSQADLLTLISNGPRPVGSKENEEYAVNFIKSEVLKVKENANKIHTITITDQIVSGSYFIDQRPVGYVTQYHNVQNIIVRLSSNSKKNSSAVLVNCHFDSVPGSPGASDDAFHCTVMLELLRILSRLQNPFLHDIIFLFNGAEESGLQASHGFIAHHEWAKDVKTFVNLEASGAGGKEVLFQSGPNAPWLLEAYAQAVPHPHGNVMAEELFQGGVIPSDTDFRIFRDFGHVPGFDFANADNGFVYHTKFDNGALVPLGSFQHTGDNMLALLQALANSPLLDLKDLPGGSMIYFDLLGFCFVKYSQKFGLVLNVVVSLLSLGTILCLLSKIKKASGYSVLEIALQYGCAITTTLGGWILSVVYIYLLTMFLNWMKLTQSWYRSYFYLLSLYYFSTVLFCVMVPYLVLVNKRQKLSNIQHCKINSLATQFIWTLLLLLGAAMGIRSSYIIMILVLCPTLSNLGLLFYRNHGVKTWVIFQFLQSVLPMLMGIYLSLMVLSSFIPITNRSGSGINIELAIGILCASTCIMNVSYLVPFTVCMRHISVVISLVSVHILGLLILIVSRPLPFYNWPSGESGVLQRVPLWHVQRTLHDESGMVRLSDSGFWMINMDCSSPHHLKNVVTELNSAVKASSLCESELFCALPLYSPRMSRWINDSIWIQGPKPFDKSIIHMATQIDSVMDQRKRMSFNISGPNQLSFMFSPLPGVTAVDWSLEADLVPSQKFKGRPSYFVFYQKGLPAPSWTFYIDFQIDTSRNLNSNKIVTVGLVGSEINSNHFSKDYKKLINSYPDWAFITPRASELKMWEL